jgi:phosphoribosylformylglycinamidine cyclo-ligase
MLGTFVIIVDSTVTARMKRSKVIDNANIKAGDVIVGLALWVIYL